MNINRLVLVTMLLSFAIPVSAAASGYGDLGRLFTSVQQREDLDQQRRNDLVRDFKEPTKTTKKAKKAEPSKVLVNGIVQRSDGDKVVWINGKKLDGKKGPDNLRIYRGPDRDNKLVIGVPGKRAASVAPGQTLNLPDGRVAEKYMAK